MSNQYPLQTISFGDYTKIIKKTDARFVYVGLSTEEVNNIIDFCEELFQLYYDYLFFVDGGLDCYYFFPYGFRLKGLEFNISEVENLYWY